MSDNSWTHHLPPRPTDTPRLSARLTHLEPDITLCTVTNGIQPGPGLTLGEALSIARHDDNPHLVVDLSAITSLDSTALFLLLEAGHNYRRDDRGHCAVVARPELPGIPEIYAIALTVTLDVHHTLGSAIYACTTP